MNKSKWKVEFTPTLGQALYRLMYETKEDEFDDKDWLPDGSPSKEEECLSRRHYYSKKLPRN